ncbi:uncharacterized protein LOC135346741 isoform X2 [Halichondria panicea]|uniref:uncharacterized protein LOC135346741 isoform X2 n=1 Tax=Halichondria panicea TaxID=6063 RepID=UPI00312BAC16
MTPVRPNKKRRIKRKSRKPDPCQSTTTTTQTSRSSSLVDDLRKKLTFTIDVGVKVNHKSPWTESETKVLVNYLRTRGHSNQWPTTKSQEFWRIAADFVHDCNPDSSERSGSACRNRVWNLLRKRYEYEAKYIRAVLGWRQSCDTRGLSQLQRCKGNYQMLNLILEELMPWANECNYNYSLFEVNRSVSAVCGFTREVLTALVADIETREWRRCLDLSPEHPRASTTDDVECFFSVMRDMVGTHFTVK